VAQQQLHVCRMWRYECECEGGAGESRGGHYSRRNVEVYSYKLQAHLTTAVGCGKLRAGAVYRISAAVVCMYM